MLSSLSIIGLGKLGAPMTACFAARGFTVHAVDLNPQKVDSIARGVSPVNGRCGAPSATRTCLITPLTGLFVALYYKRIYLHN